MTEKIAVVEANNDALPGASIDPMEQIIAVHLGFEDGDVASRIRRSKTMKAPATQRSFAPAVPRVSLSEFQSLDPTGVSEMIARRTSHRDYVDRPMTMGELAFILRGAVGTKAYRSNAYNVSSYPVSSAPSAGGLQPLNIYVYVSQVKGLESGVYYYAPNEDELVELWLGRPDLDLARIFMTDFSPRAPVSIAVTGDIDRFAWKYGYRGYRLLNVDCGVAAAYLGLVAESIGIGTCAVAAFSATAVSASLDLKSHELPLLCISMGPKRG